MQHFIVKLIQGFNIRTRSDICESMLGLYRLSAEVEKRKLMFVHKILQMSNASITQKLFIRKYFLYISNNDSVKLGFIPDICSLLHKYNLQYLVNNFTNNQCEIPSKYAWKCIVKKAVYSKETILWKARLSIDSDFMYFKLLQEDIKPALVYTLSKNYAYIFTANKVAKIWSRSIIIENKTCLFCAENYEDYITHIVGKCLITSDMRESFFNDICSMTNADLVNCLKQLNEKDLLKLLGSNKPPYVNETYFVSFMIRCYKFIIDCHQYFELYV